MPTSLPRRPVSSHRSSAQRTPTLLAVALTLAAVAAAGAVSARGMGDDARHRPAAPPVLEVEGCTMLDVPCHLLAP